MMMSTCRVMTCTMLMLGREAPRANFLEGLGGKLYFDKLVEDHRWEPAMAEEWENATVVTYDEEE